MSNFDILQDLSATRSGKTTRAYDVSAVVMRIEDDVAWVHIDGGVDETPVKLTVSAHEGDVVQVRVGGGTAWLTGNGTRPPTDDATAIVAQETADVATSIAESNAEELQRVNVTLRETQDAVTEAREIADATNQHFWADENGVHIATTEGAASSGKNLLMNSLGILLRASGLPLAQFSSSQVAFYDGTGSGEDHIVALFGVNGAQVGYSDLAHIMLRSDTMRMVSDKGMDMLNVTSNGISDYAEIKKTIDDDFTSITGTSSSNRNHLWYTLPLTNYTSGGRLRIVYEVRYVVTVSGRQETRITKGFDYFTIGTDENTSHSIQSVQCSVEYSHSAILDIYAYKTTSDGRYFRLRSITYEGYTPMPVYDLGTRAISANNAGAFSAVIGEMLLAAGDRQLVTGKYNVEDTNDDYALIIGNGSDDSNRSNALTVDWNGTIKTADGFDSSKLPYKWKPFVSDAVTLAANGSTTYTVTSVTLPTIDGYTRFVIPRASKSQAVVTGFGFDENDHLTVFLRNLTSSSVEFTVRGVLMYLDNNNKWT
jgi:hypothetical protein